MAASMAQLSTPPIPPEVQQFAAAQGVSQFLPSAIELCQEAFPSSPLQVSLAEDTEDQSHRYIALDVAAGNLTSDELLAGQRIWSDGMTRICPSRRSVYFVLGWR